MKKPDRRGKTVEDDAPLASDISTVGVPLLIPVVAPRLSSMSHSALIKWKKARAEYEESVKARSKGDDELYERLKETIKSTVDERLLKALCTYRRGGIAPNAVTDDQITSEIQAIVERVINDTLPDIDMLFGKKLRLNMSETDVNERVLHDLF
ncbi:uncharacterized protein PITG_01540 [Phytophthora infestans T30-4]|uniref:Uncharacterized protein n=1 Tax=Phytophthora infestans (strain T30-4) TaxID=403677 RepID=D0MTH6_PHYIT|nr:uncharacterized protein PITG_01540 [Phytophthora infestans T30-4]EEY61273.1 conserved hypothetical protein [Phytophthora infestans T30-4]|eukprot:XP_002908190.1 conserved hypothetical protein [Phytophthora infestans T30-4]